MIIALQYPVGKDGVLLSSMERYSIVTLQQGWGRGWVRDDVEVGLLLLLLLNFFSRVRLCATP